MIRVQVNLKWGRVQGLGSGCWQGPRSGIPHSNCALVRVAPAVPPTQSSLPGKAQAAHRATLPVSTHLLSSKNGCLQQVAGGRTIAVFICHGAD